MCRACNWDFEVHYVTCTASGCQARRDRLVVKLCRCLCNAVRCTHAMARLISGFRLHQVLQRVGQSSFLCMVTERQTMKHALQAMASMLGCHVLKRLCLTSGQSHT